MNNYYQYNFNRNTMNNVDLFSPKEGFEKGNMFSNLYSEYKNYKPQNLKPKNDKEQKLLNIQAICFASHELNLYLDLHPEDQSMITLFNDYMRKEEELIKEYESMYGPFTVKDGKMTEWVNEKWPWEVDNV